MEKNSIPTKANVDYKKVYVFENTRDNIATFKAPLGQRELTETHIKEVVEAYKRSGKFFASIQVNINTLHCFDGNYRLAAYEVLRQQGVRVDFEVKFYDMTPEEEARELTESNNHSRKWNSFDYIKCRIERGDESMKKIWDFALSYNNSPKAVIIKNSNKPNQPKMRYVYAIMFGRNISSLVSDFDAKLPDVTDEVIKKSREIYAEVSMMLRQLEWDKTNNWAESLCCAWSHVRDNMNGKFETKHLNKLLEMNPAQKSSTKYWEGIFNEMIEYGNNN